jgi:RND family efflux transporter MFP subunit
MVALLGLAAGLQGCKEDVVKTERPRPVRVATVALEPLAQARRYAGVIKARYESDLGFRIAGKILERHVNVGDEVRAGQILARVDATDFKLSLEAQEAELTAAQSNRDQAVAAEARYEELNARGHVAQAALDVRRAAAVEARSRVERAERALEVQRNQVGYTELRADRDGVVGGGGRRGGG